MAIYYREYSPSNCLANGLFLAASLSMKQSGQKSKLCVTLIACFITSSGKIFCIFSRPSTYILHVAITDVAISEVVLCSTSLDAWLHACLRLSSPNAENIFKMATAVELVKWLARLIADVGAGEENLFSCCFPVLRRALYAVGPVGQEPQ